MIIENQDYETGEGTEVSHNLKQVYTTMILDKINIQRPIRVAMDCGNAAGAILGPSIFRKMVNVQLTELYCDIDGTFPNHHPDPTVKKNLQDLISLMEEGNHDIGVAFDGDADRVGVVDETGDIIWADQLMALFLPEVIENEGDDILYDVKCSQSLEEMIEKYGGRPVMWKTGHSLIKQKMHELGCRLGGEMSGHIFFADDYYGYDDAIYVAARICQTLSRSTKTLSAMKEELPVYHSTPEMRLEAENDEEKFRIAKEAVDFFTANYDCSTVDGVRIRFGDGWGLVRSSNTQPVIVCRFEADTLERMTEIKELVLGKLREIGTLRDDVGH